MAGESLPILPTTVIGAHCIPPWLWAAEEKFGRGELGAQDLEEARDDAVRLAIREMEAAGIDIVSDGEMRRLNWIHGFYSRFDGFEKLDAPQQAGITGYRGLPRYRAVGRLHGAAGLGLVEEFEFARKLATQPLKCTCPGPVSMTAFIDPHPAYTERIEAMNDMADLINAELKRLAAAGAEFIQLDDVYQHFLMTPQTLVELYNRCTDGVEAKLGYHICFGTHDGFHFAKRTYRGLFPALCEARADQFALEFGNRLMAEADLWQEFNVPQELGAGVLDMKSFYVETPEVIAKRIRRLLEFVPVEKLALNPDCGLGRTPRHIGVPKLRAMVEGARIVRRELTGKD